MTPQFSYSDESSKVSDVDAALRIQLDKSQEELRHLRNVQAHANQMALVIEDQKLQLEVLEGKLAKMNADMKIDARTGMSQPPQQFEVKAYLAGVKVSLEALDTEKANLEDEFSAIARDA